MVRALAAAAATLLLAGCNIPPPTPGPTGSPSPSPSTSATPSPSASPSPSPSATPSPSASPSPSPSPSPSGRACPAFPTFPDASCTGVPAGTVLKSCAGTITRAGSTWDGCLFTGGVYIADGANNVTIRNSKVIGRVNARYGEQTGLVLMDVEIDGEDRLSDNQSGIGDDNYTCIRCNVHRTGRGASARFNVTIVDSWFHDFDHRPGDHESAIGSNGGHDMLFRHNRLECAPTQYCSGALVVYNNSDPVDGVTIEQNLLNGGSYCLYAGSSVGPAKNVVVRDNRWGKDHYPRCAYYGPVAHWSSGNGNVWQGNAWADGSGAVNP